VSYKNLEIWQDVMQLVIDIHQMTVDLPKSEQYEEGMQIRRSIKTVRSCIVEGYGRRKYKADYIRFLIYAISSNDETIDHLEILYETGSLTDKTKFNDLSNRLCNLGKKLNRFIKAIEMR
jgi:four helix bundle protein